ncbi:hypothetical protein THAOC_19419, partial [Thalassiosira oceanica]
TQYPTVLRTPRPVSSAGDIVAEVVSGTHNAVGGGPPDEQAGDGLGRQRPGGRRTGGTAGGRRSQTQWHLTNDLYLHGFLRSSYYCGARFRFDASTCASARPCPAGRHGDCPGGEHCFPDTPCADLIDGGGGGGGGDGADDGAPSPTSGDSARRTGYRASSSSRARRTTTVPSASSAR